MSATADLPFEAAVNAVITGDEAALRSLLRESPELIRARSSRDHHATLLHYVSANGVEDERQKTPANAVAMTKVLLAAGAEVDAVADSYGKSTTLGLVATSIHPLRAGVQIPLLEVLLEAGAAIEGVRGGWSPLVSALRNGRREASEFLARRGAALDLEGAAGVGRLDRVKSFFNDDGNLKPEATDAQLESGFNWACEYGRTSVVEFLLRRGVDARAQQSGLHWAAIGGHLDILMLFVERHASLEGRSQWGGTVLETAVWGAQHDETGADYAPVLRALMAAGANVDADPGLRERVDALLAAGRGR